MEFNKFCEDEGLEHQLIVGYALEQNNISERKNKTIMETKKICAKGDGSFENHLGKGSKHGSLPTKQMSY